MKRLMSDTSRGVRKPHCGVTSPDQEIEDALLKEDTRAPSTPTLKCNHSERSDVQGIPLQLRLWRTAKMSCHDSDSLTPANLDLWPQEPVGGDKKTESGPTGAGGTSLITGVCAPRRERAVW